MILKDIWFQEKAENAVFKYLDANPEKHPLVALPTGSGKTAVMARIARRIIANKKNSILLLGHESEILKQNHRAMNNWVQDAAIYSAGLNVKDIDRITVAGIQSVYRYPELFEDFTHVIIDEAHTIPMSDTSMYRSFLNSIGDHTRIGLTATPYRLGQGYIIGEDHLFDKIVIDYTYGNKYQRLVDEKFICPLVINNTEIKMDTKNIKIQGGDFKIDEMSEAFDREELTNEILDEMIIKGKDRKRWLIFAIDIKHADHICEGLVSRGITAMPVHSDMPFSKGFVLDKHKRGIFKCVVSVGMLTTGYDDPAIDLIGLLRPTTSPNLHVQMPGRGQRVHPDKENCLVLDYAGNTKRLGPINYIKPKKKRKRKESGEAITKDCPECNSIVHPSVRICPTCGYEFKFRSNLELTSSADDIVSIQSKWYDVQSVDYNMHTKKGMPNGIKATYYCGLRHFNNWILPDHAGASGIIGRNKLRSLGIEHEDLRKSIRELNLAIKPTKVLIEKTGRYPNVVDVFYEKIEKIIT